METLSKLRNEYNRHLKELNDRLLKRTLCKLDLHNATNRLYERETGESIIKFENAKEKYNAYTSLIQSSLFFIRKYKYLLKKKLNRKSLQK